MTVGLFTGPVTDGERRHWQRRAHLLLGDLLKLGLPPLTWTISSNSLVGRAHQDDPSERRTAWEAWVVHLNAATWPERASAGYRHLHAVAKGYRDNVDVGILADVDEDEPS